MGCTTHCEFMNITITQIWKITDECVIVFMKKETSVKECHCNDSMVVVYNIYCT